MSDKQKLPKYITVHYGKNFFNKHLVLRNTLTDKCWVIIDVTVTEAFHKLNEGGGWTYSDYFVGKQIVF